MFYKRLQWPDSQVERHPPFQLVSSINQSSVDHLIIQKVHTEVTLENRLFELSAVDWPTV